MTIAAGMMHRDGVALWADTLVGGASTGRYESKMMGYTFHDGIAVFGLAGEVTFAHDAIQVCEPTLRNGTGRTHGDIAASLRLVLGSEYERLRAQSGYSPDVFLYELVVAIWSKIDGIGLYCADRASFSEVTNGCQFVGTGHDLGEFLVRPEYNSAHATGIFPSESETLSLAAYALTRVRKAQPNLVGGNPVLMTLRSYGETLFWRQTDFDSLDRFAGIYDAFSRTALKAFLNDASLTDFESSLKSFVNLSKHQKSEWLKEQRSVIWAAIPPAARYVMKDLTK